MSTRDAIEAAKSAGLLTPFVPPIGWASTPRAFLMAQQLVSQIDAGLRSANQAEVERWDRLRGDIAHFVGGGLITWKLMKWLEPKKFEHWALRSVRPRPSLRVFGRFVEPNVFVGTHASVRSTLGGKWSLEFELEKLRCEDVWKAAGLPPPFIANACEDYITDNAIRNLRVIS